MPTCVKYSEKKPGHLVNNLWSYLKQEYEKVTLSTLKNIMAKLSHPIRYQEGSRKANCFCDNYNFSKLETIIWLNPYVREQILVIKMN